jgi:hypothetical protein
MIARVKTEKVGTGVVLRKVKRSYTADMLNLAGMYVEVFTDEKNKDWLVMREEYLGNKFAFHKSWVEIDKRRNSAKPIILECGKAYDVRTKTGVLSAHEVLKLTEVTQHAAKREHETNTDIGWISFRDLVIASDDWLIHQKSSPLDQRYKKYTKEKYGVTVPDLLCSAIAEVAKKGMIAKKDTMLTFVPHEKYIEAILGDDLNKALHVTLYLVNNWIVVSGNAVCSEIVLAEAVKDVLGKDKFTYSRIAVKNMNNCLCIHRTSERGAISTKTYELEA